MNPSNSNAGWKLLSVGCKTDQERRMKSPWSIKVASMLNYSSKYSITIDKTGPGVTYNDYDTVTFKTGDLKLSASKTHSTFEDINRLGVQDFVLAVEKPDCFIVDYNVRKNDVRVQFMNKIKVANKTLNLTAVNNGDGAWRSLGGSLDINPTTKVYVNHVFGGNTKFRSRHYLHNRLVRFEPSYNLKKNALKVDFSYTKPTEVGDTVFRATYKTSNNKLGLEWAHNSKKDKPINKISASIDMADMWKLPKVCFERTMWESDIGAIYLQIY